MKLFQWTLIPTDEYNKIIKTNKQLHNLENWLSCHYGQLLIKIPTMYEGELVSEYEERVKLFMNSIERQADELNDMFYKTRLSEHISLLNKLRNQKRNNKGQFIKKTE